MFNLFIFFIYIYFVVTAFIFILLLYVHKSYFTLLSIYFIFKLIYP